MVRRIIGFTALIAMFLLMTLTVSTVFADTGDPVLLNEVLASHTGTDDTEYVELYGDPGASLAGLSVIVVESDAFSPGTIDRRVDFQAYEALGANGFYLLGNCGGLDANYGVTPDATVASNFLENSSLTLALVETDSVGDVGDTVTGSEVVLDAVALTDGDAGDTFFFGAPVIGPDGPFFPAGARRLADGVDTNTTADWAFADFGLGSDNTPTGGGVDGCSPLSATIPEIQGDGQYSLYEGAIVSTSGVVTLISGNGRDMWVQDVSGDGNPATSDGIFVDDRDRLDPMPEVGDLIIFAGEVEEQQFGTALPRTRIDDPDDYPFEIVSSGNRLPSPINLVNLPDELLAEGIDFWEALEGMLVRVPGAVVTSPTNGFGEFGMITKYDLIADSGFSYETFHLLISYDEGADFLDYNPERIVVDDSALDTPDVMPGDNLRRVVGVVDYTFSNYKLQLASIGDIRPLPKRPEVPVSERSGPLGNLTVTTYNVENLFDLVDNPDKDDIGTGGAPDQAALDLQLAKLALAIELELALPEIIVVQEVENQEILQELGDLVNAAAGTSYVATSFETSDGRGIEAGFLWDADRVSLMEAFQLSGPDVEAAFGPPSPSPGREPLAGLFRVSPNFQDPLLWVVGNHFKSKRGDDPLYGVNQPPIRISEVQRKAQAQVVRDFVNGIFEEDPEAWVMVAGDLNDFQFPEPGEGADHPVAILEGMGDEVPLTNLVNLVPAGQQFTFVFDGNSQVLDHILVSPALLEVKVAQDILHFNTSYPATYAEDATTPLHASDHDAVEARFNLKSPKILFPLSVLHNNDGESQLIDLGGDLTDFGGVARFKTLVDDLRSDNKSGKIGSIMVSSGDNFLAGPEWQASQSNGVPFYDTIAMDLIGYDAVDIGNHDFDFGPDILADFIEGYELTKPPYLSSNLLYEGEPRLQALFEAGRIARSTVVYVNGHAIGIVGATTPNLDFISSPRNVVVLDDVAAAVQAEVDGLESMGINKIVLISHLQGIVEDIELAADLHGVDIMIAGGGDELLANPGDLLVPEEFDSGDPVYPTPFGAYPMIAVDSEGVKLPVVTTQGSYSYVGRLTVGFDVNGNLLMVNDDMSGPVRVAGGAYPDAVAPDASVQALVVDPVAAALDELATNVIATSEVDLDGLRSSVRSMETNEGNLIADSQLWQASQVAADFGFPTPDVALQNGGGIRNDNVIPAGDITELDTFSMAPFSNFLSIMPDISREQFKEIMENTVACTQVDDFTTNPSCGSGRFAQIAGFSMTWTASGVGQILDEDGNVTTAGTRVLEVTLDDGTVIVTGGSVVAGDAITIAISDFLANGGDQYPFRGAPVTTVGFTYQQALNNYIVDALGGLISAADYPEGGEGRNTELP